MGMSDQSFKMYLAPYFSTLSKTGRSVLDCISNTKNVLSSCKCYLDYFAKSNGDKITISNAISTCTVDFCEDCKTRLEGGYLEACEKCTELGFQYSLLELRPCLILLRA